MVPGWPNSVIDVDVLEISRISRLQKNVPEKQLRKPAATDGTYLNIGVQGLTAYWRAKSTTL